MTDLGRLQLPNCTFDERNDAYTEGLGRVGVLEATIVCEVAIIFDITNLDPVYLHSKAS